MPGAGLVAEKSTGLVRGGGDAPADPIFSYDGLAAFLRELAATHAVFPLERWTGQPGVILRHDVDLDPAAAMAVAEVEIGVGVSSSFFFMVTAETYNVASPGNRALVRRLAGMGFEIGLHFDPAVGGEADDDTLRARLDAEGRHLSDLAGTTVGSVSLHCPSVLGRYPLFPGWRNAYDPRIFAPDRYLSDSCGVFRQPPATFFRPGGAMTYQLLLHPLHYSPTGSPYPAAQLRYCRNRFDALDDIFACNPNYRAALDGRRLADLVGWPP